MKTIPFFSFQSTDGTKVGSIQLEGGNIERVGSGAGEGYTVLFPINREIGEKKEVISDNDYIYACETALFPIIRKFEPELIVVSAGFDSAHGDVLGKFDVTPLGYAWIT